MLIRKTTMALVAILLLATFNACQKETSSKGTTNLKVRLTDSPFNASEVNIDIRQVRVSVGDSSAWVDLNTHASIYNVLGLQNGVDTLLATGVVPTGPLNEIRFVLGSDNSIVIDSVEYPLTVPSGSESGLKIKVDRALNASVDSLLIDFDATLSIIKTGNDKYILKPVIKIK